MASVLLFWDVVYFWSDMHVLWVFFVNQIFVGLMNQIPQYWTVVGTLVFSLPLLSLSL